MKKRIILIFVFLLPLVSFADEAEINGIWYNLVSKAKQAEVIKYKSTSYSGNIDIPATVEYGGANYSVTSIDNSAFKYCSGLTSVTIPNSVTSIGNSAFSFCRSLTSVTIGTGVTSIGEYAFSDCSCLTSVHILDLEAWCKIEFYGSTSNPLHYAEHLFMDGKEIIDLVIPNSVTSIGSYAFRSCRSLTSVTIGNGVTSIGNFAFESCSGLTSVHISDLEAWCKISLSNGYSNPLCYAQHLFLNGEEVKNLIIPNSVNSIGNYAFEKCSGLTSVTIPNSVTSIGGSAFSGCSGLTSVTIGSGVINIGDYTFYGCSGLTSVTIPNGVTSIGQLAFESCSGLTSVTIGSGVTSIGGGAFSGCSGLTSVTIPNSVTSIGNSAFWDCSGLTSVTIGSGVTNIGDDTFYGCSSLTSVTIPNSVTRIGRCAFYGCQELTDVFCYAENVPNTDNYAFEGSYIEYATLHVPAASIEQYKAKEPWSLFGTIVSLDGDTPEPPKPEKCATPTISYNNGELSFNCETEGVEYVSEVTDSDIKKNYTEKIKLSVTYNLTVYATKTDYENSDTIQATLCWIDAEPKTEGIAEDAVTEVQALPVLIQSNSGTINVQGLDAGTLVSIYSTDGKQQGSNVVVNGATTIRTSLLPGSIAVVRIGEKTVKVVIK